MGSLVLARALRRPVVIPRRGSRGELGSILGKEFPMRSLSRMGLGLLGLALVAAPTAWADPPRTSLPIGAGAAAQPRRSLFHKSHLCPKCQWEQLRARGINVPPPPTL